VPIAAAWALAWTTLGLVALIVLGLLLLRCWRWYDQPRQAAFEAVWRPWLMRCALGEGVPSDLPRLSARQRWPWMRLWLHLHMSLQGPARGHLAAWGRTMGVTELALARVHGSHQSERLVGLLALGFLQDGAHEPLLLQFLAQGRQPVVVYAARALLELDARRHASALVQALLACEGLDMSLVSVLLKPFRSDLHSALLAQCPPPSAPSVLPWLRLAQALQLQCPQRVLTPFLQPEQDPEWLMAALRLVQGEQGSAAAVALARHPDWRVRAQAARALAEIGTPSDAALLVRLTMDAQWWVRYRAAQALLRLPGMKPAQALQQVQATGDRYAQNMLQAVMAEEGQHA
jgi:hypothetical protein